MTNRVPRIGFAIALAALLVDRVHKFWMLGPFAIEEKGRVALLPFLDLVMVWNRGVSYGLFTQGGDAGRWLLIGIGVVGAALFSWWLLTTRRMFTAFSLALVIGGALSNVIDRVLYGAVADFFLLHVGPFEWYVFNLADVWIVAGAIGLLLAWVTERPEIATEP